MEFSVEYAHPKSEQELTIYFYIVFCLYEALGVLALWDIVSIDTDVMRNRDATLLQRSWQSQ